jgi:hypothetical protein
MAVCVKCGNKKLTWTMQFGSWKLYESDTGQWHNKNCKLTGEDMKKIKDQKANNFFENRKACKHGILLDRLCQFCESERG